MWNAKAQMIFWNFSRKYGELHYFYGARALNEVFSPESENAQQTEAPEEVPEVPADLTKMFEFTTIDQVERLAHVLVNYYNGRNDLFKNEKKNRFYLVIHKDDHTPEEFNKVCNIICEYAQQKNYNPAVGAYFAEHGNKITGPQALQVFASL